MKRIFFPLLLSVASLAAEIKTVQLTWDSAQCNESCQSLVQRRFKQSPDVMQAEVGPGSLILTWKPNRPFSWTAVRQPMQSVGLGINSTQVTVRGTVIRAGEKIFLNSLGDNTRFELTSPPAPRAGQFIEYNNTTLYKLSPDLLAKFTQAAEKKQVVTATGYLLMPWRIALTLIVGQYHIEGAEVAPTVVPGQGPNANPPTNQTNPPQQVPYKRY